MASVVGYLANLSKSVAYSAVDRVQKMTPATAQFVDTNSELLKTVYSDIINFRQTYTRGMETVKKGKIYEAVDEGKKALFEDIKNGTFYNKKRTEAFERRAMGIDAFNDSLGGSDSFGGSGDDGFGDFDMDDGWDDFEDDFTDSEANAQAISTAVAKSAEYTANVQKASTNILYTQNIKAMNMLSSGFDSMNKNITNLAPLVDMTQAGFENQRKFYEKTETLLTDAVGLLRSMNEIALASRPKPQKERQRDNINFSDVIGAAGMPDLKLYAKAIKQNVMNNGGSMIESMMGMFKDDENPNANPLLAFVASPLKFIPDMIVNKLIPKELDKAAEKFDKSLSGFFGSLMAKFNNMAEDEDGNIVTQYMGKLLGMKGTVKRRIDTSRYNKDATNWNGKNSKSLNEVIPTYLRKILAAVTGQDEMVYDYDKGAFINAAQIKQSFKSLQDSYSNSATSEVRDKMIENSKTFTFDNIKERESLEKAITNVLKQSFDDGKLFNVNSKDPYLHNKYGTSKKEMAMIKALFRSLDNNEALRLNTDILEGREKLNNQMEQLGKSETIFSTLFDSSKSGDMIHRDKKTGEIDRKKSSYYEFGMYSKDDLGHNIFYYLQNMYKELKFFNINGSGSRNGIPTSPYINAGGRVKEKPIIDEFGQKHWVTHTSADDIQIKDDYDKAGKSKKKFESEKSINDRFLKTEKDRIAKAHKGTVADMSEVDDDRAEIKAMNVLAVQKTDAKIKEMREQKKTWVQQGIDDLLEANNLSDKMKVAIQKIQAVSAKPMSFVTNVLDKADKRLYEMIYGRRGEDGKDVKGIIDLFARQMKETFGKVNLWLEDNILKPLKDKFATDSFKDLKDRLMEKIGLKDLGTRMGNYLFGEKDGDGKRQGGLLGGIRDGIRDSFKNAKNSVKDAFKNVFNPIKDKFKSKEKKNGFEDLDDENYEYKSDTNTAQVAYKAKEKELNDLFGGPLDKSKFADSVQDKNKANREYLVAITKGIDKTPRQMEQELLHAKMSGSAISPRQLEELEASTEYYKANYSKSKNAQSVINHLNEKNKTPITKTEQLQALLDRKNNELSNLQSSSFVPVNKKDKLGKTIDGLIRHHNDENSISDYHNKMVDRFNYMNSLSIDDMSDEDKKAHTIALEKLRSIVYTPGASKKLFQKELKEKITPLQNQYNSMDGTEIEDDFSSKKAQIAKLQKEIELLNNGIIKKKIKDNISPEEKNLLRLAESKDANVSQSAKALLGSKFGHKEYLPKPENIASALPKVDVNDAMKHTSFGDEIKPIITPLQKIEGYFKELIDALKGVGTRRNNNRRGGRRSRLNRRVGFDPGESDAANDFSTDLAQVLAQTISDYMHSNVKFNALGDDEVDETSVRVVSKGEKIVPAKDVEAIKNILFGSEERIKSGHKNSKVAGHTYDGLQKMFANIPPEMQSVYMSTLAELMENGGTTLTAVQKAHYKNINKKVQDKLYAQEGPLSQNKERSDAAQLAVDSMKNLGSGISEVTQSLTGKSAKEQKDRFGAVVDDMTKNISDYAPDAMGSALIGGGVSLLTGALGGPLLGAAVGAGISIAKRSEAVQNMLFGEKDEKGDRTGGLVGKDFVNKAKKYLPDLKNFGIVGGIAGLMPFLPFGPITGIMLGSAFSYAKNNETVHEKLFGDTGIFKPKSREKFKKLLPKLGAGAAAMAIMGPFGLIPNALLGATAGYVTTTDSFKKMLLGTKDSKGVYQNGILPAFRKVLIDPIKSTMGSLKDGAIGYVKKKILAPLENAFQPLKKQVELAVKGMFGGVGKFLKKMFTNTLGLPMYKWMEEHVFQKGKKAMNFLWKFLSFIPKHAIAAPFQLIGGLGTLARRRQLKRGNADYMTAEERNNYRMDHDTFNMTGGDKYASTDAILASMSAGGELNKLKGLHGSLSNLTATKKDLAKRQSSLLSNMGNQVVKHMGWKESKKFMTAVKDGKHDKAIAIIAKNKTMSGEERRQLETKMQNYGRFSNTKEAKDKLVDEALGKLKNAGFEGLSKKDLVKDKKGTAKLLKYLEIEIKQLESKKKELTPEDISKREALAKEKDHKEIVSKFDEVLDILKGTKENIQDLTKKDLHAKEKAIEEGKQYFTASDGKRYKIDKDGKHILDKKDPINKAILRNEEKQKKVDKAKEKRAANDKAAAEKGKRDSRGMLHKKNAQGELIPDLSDNITYNAVHKLKADENYKRSFWEKIKTKMIGSDTQGKDGRKESHGVLGKLLAGFSGLTGMAGNGIRGILGLGGSVLGGTVGTGLKMGGGLLGGTLGILGRVAGTGFSVLSKFGSLGVIGGVIGTGVALANTPKLVGFFKDTVVPWLKDKAIPWIKDNVIPAMGEGAKELVKALPSILSFVVKDMVPLLWDALKSVGKGIINGLGELLENGFNSVKNAIFHPTKDGNVKANAEDEAKVKAKYADKESLDRPSTLSPNTKAGAAELPNSTSAQVTTTNDQSVTPQSTNSSKSSSNDANWASSIGGTYIRNVLTGGATGDLTKFGSKLGGFVNKAGTVVDHVAHPIKSINKFAKAGIKAGATKVMGEEAVSGITKKMDIVRNSYNMVRHPIDFWKTAKEQGFKDTITAEAKVKPIKNVFGSILHLTGKGIEKGTEAADKFGSKVMKSGVMSTVTRTANAVVDPILNNIKKFFGELLTDSTVSRLIGADKCKAIMEKGLPKILTKIGASLAKNAAKITAKIVAAASSAGLLNLAWAVADFVSGYRHTKEILGITQEPSFGMKIVSGLLKAFNGLFIVLSFIPESVWVDLLLDTILPIFGVEDTEIQKMRAKTRDELAKYNKETGQDLSMEDYVNKLPSIKLDSTLRDTGKTLRQMGKQLTLKSSTKQLNEQESKDYKEYKDNLTWYENIGDNAIKLVNRQAQSSAGKWFANTGVGKAAADFGSWANNKLGWVKPEDFQGGPNPKLNGIGGPDTFNEDDYLKTEMSKYKGMGGGNIKGIPMGTAQISSAYTNYDDIFKSAGSKFGVDPELLKALSMQESSGDPNKSNGAALGLMQIENGGTTEEFINFGKKTYGQNWTAEDRADPSKAVPFGASRLSEDIKRYNGDYLKAIQAYNFSHYSLDKLIKAFPDGDDWLSHRSEMGQYNGTGRANYGDPKYVEHVLQYYNGTAIKSDGTGIYQNTGSTGDKSSKPGISNLFSELGSTLTGAFGKLYGFKDDAGSSSGDNTITNLPAGVIGNIIKSAQAKIGDPYVWGGTGSPLTESTVQAYKGSAHDISKASNWRDWLGKPGYDCSGLMQTIFHENGVEIGRSTYDQVKEGKAIAVGQQQAGDLLFFGDASKPDHVGLSLGDGRFIEAPQSGKTVTISDEASRRNLSAVRRIVEGQQDTTPATGGPKSGIMALDKKNIGGPADNYFSKKLKGNLTSAFGKRRGGGVVSSNHTGIDIGSSQGTSIPTPVSGIVSKKATPGNSNGYGNLITIKDKYNNEHYFGHMQNSSNLNVGDKVNAGDVVGKVGSTGNSTGPHLHYETKVNGVSVEPNRYLSKYAQGGPTPDPEDAKKLKEMNKLIDEGTSTGHTGKGGQNEIPKDKFNTIVALLTQLVTNTSSISSIVNLITKILDFKTGNNSNNTNQQSGTQTANTRKNVIDQVKKMGLGQNTDSDNVEGLLSLLNSIVQM